jgi:hypothetical protein
MKKIIIIGNGFDLNLGYKTKFQDFFKWLLIKLLTTADSGESINNHYPKKLFELKKPIRHVDANSKIDSIMEKGNSNEYISFASILIHFLMKAYAKNHNWFCIEKIIFENIKEYFYQPGFDENDKKNAYISINHSVKFLSDELENYLFEETKSYKFKPVYNTKLFQILKKAISSEDYLVLNFNYTNTIYPFLKDGHKEKVIHIHGKIHNSENKIIIGYSSENDELHKVMRNTNQSIEAYTYFKPNNILLRDSFKRFKDFIRCSDYEIDIIGHSCSEHDDYLLDDLFSSPHCNRITPYYYNEDDRKARLDNIFKRLKFDKNSYMKIYDSVDNILK